MNLCISLYIKSLLIVFCCFHAILSEKLKKQSNLIDSQSKILEVTQNIAKIHQVENLEITSNTLEEAIQRIQNHVQSLLDEEELKSNEMNSQIENQMKIQKEIIQSSVNEIQQSDSNILDFIKLLQTSESEQKELEKRLDLYKTKVAIMKQKQQILENQQTKEENDINDAIAGIDSAAPILLKFIEYEEQKKGRQGFLSGREPDIQAQFKHDIFPLFQTSCSNPVVKQILEQSSQVVNEDNMQKLSDQIKILKERLSEKLIESKHRFQEQVEETQNELKNNEQVYEETLCYSNEKKKIKQLEIDKRALAKNQETSIAKLQNLENTLKNLKQQCINSGNKLKEEISLLKQCENELKEG